MGIELQRAEKAHRIAADIVIRFSEKHISNTYPVDIMEALPDLAQMIETALIKEMENEKIR